MIRKSHQILFWILTLLFLNILFGQKWNDYYDAFYFTTMLMPIAISTSYFFNYFLVPRYLFDHQYFRFILYTVYTIIISVFLSQLVVIVSFVILANLKWDEMDPLITDVLQLDIVIYFIVFLFSLIHLFQSNLRNRAEIYQLTQAIKTKTINVKSNRQTISISIDEILYIESLADYVKIITISGTTITREKISQLEKRLPDWFIRCHRSFLFNHKWVKKFGYDYVTVQSEKLPIGRKFRENVLAQLKGD